MTDLVIQPDGKVLATGFATEVLIIGGSARDFALSRYNPNGGLDPTFGTGGKVITDFANSDGPQVVVLQTDGKILAAGTTQSDFAIMRYNPNGTPDPTFGNAGLATADFSGTFDGAFDAVIQSDNKILLAGMTSGSTSDFGIARFAGDIITTACTYSDDFEDGVLASDWTYVKQTWNETSGNLIGTPATRKAEVIATPAFQGCITCNFQAKMQTAGGASNKIWFFGWFQDKNNTVEVLMKEEQDKWILRQRANGSIIAKVKASATILPNVSYDVKIAFDGTEFTLFVDGVPLVSMQALVTPGGTLGFRVKNTVGTFGSVCVN